MNCKLNGNVLFNIVRNQIDKRMIKSLAQDPSYKKIQEEEDFTISLLKLLKDACNSNSGGGSRKFRPHDWISNMSMAPAVRQKSRINGKNTLNH